MIMVSKRYDATMQQSRYEVSHKWENQRRKAINIRTKAQRIKTQTTDRYRI